MNNVTVSLDAGTPVYTVKHDGDSQRNVFDIQLQPPRSAQEVTLARQDSNSTEQPPFLNICEVQLWGEHSLKVLLRIFTSNYMYFFSCNHGGSKQSYSRIVCISHWLFCAF